jgi:uncharacterized radical SAM superfamily protein
LEEMDLDELLRRARELSRKRFGKKIILCLPGMFLVDGKRGRYPAISITGGSCGLGCDHCKGKILEPMLRVSSPRELVELCLKLEGEGALGCLVTGGSDSSGRLPWDKFIGAIEEVKAKTNLMVSVHSGMVGDSTARAFKDVGVDQVLVEAIGSRETFREVMHLEEGERLLLETLDSLYGADLKVAPHIVAGIHGGRILGERRAMEILSQYPVDLLVWVAFMPLRETPMARCQPASPNEVARLIAESRLLFPEATIALGCARPRGRLRLELERLAMEAGVQRVGLYSEDSVRLARDLGLEVEFRETCCSMS